MVLFPFQVKQSKVATEVARLAPEVQKAQARALRRSNNDPIASMQAARVRILVLAPWSLMYRKFMGVLEGCS